MVEFWEKFGMTVPKAQELFDTAAGLPLLELQAELFPDAGRPGP